jgi:hypothetical protein
VLITALASLVVLLTAFTNTAQTDRGRIRPPAAVTCNRNNLTAYSGKVVEFSRHPGRVDLTIETDWDTTEKVTLTHSRGSDPARWFLFNGRKFKPSNWKVLDSVQSTYPDGFRATAWVCNDGRKPIIDWQLRIVGVQDPPATP